MVAPLPVLLSPAALGRIYCRRDWFRATGAVLDWKKSSMHALGRYVSGEHALPALAQQVRCPRAPPPSGTLAAGGRCDAVGPRRHTLTRRSTTDASPRHQLGRAFPWGRFLSEGAYKQVFMVVFKPLGRVEAVAVMDIRQIADTGNEAVVAQEVQVRSACCPVAGAPSDPCTGACAPASVWHPAFGTGPLRRLPPLRGQPPGEASCSAEPVPRPCPPDADRGAPLFGLSQVLVTSTGAPPRWGNREEPCPRGPSPPSPYSLPPPPSADEDGQSTEHGVYLYIRMELCDLGDAEEHMKALPDQAFPVPEIPPLFLQMVIALHEAQRRFSMRHYDVKLLNFFLKVGQGDRPQHTLARAGELTAARPAPRQSMTEDDAADVHREYAHHGRSLAVPEECVMERRQLRHLRPPRSSSPLPRCPLVKLADYGTADMSADTLNQPLTVDQFTTLENSAPEMLVLGACATQAFAIDAWAMGLCLAHLLTGEAPYEELLETVASPEPLRRALAKGLWLPPALLARQ